MLSLCAALIFSLVSAALAVWVASSLRLDGLLLALRGRRHDTVGEFIDECVRGAAGERVRSRLLRRALACRAEERDAGELRARLEEELEGRMRRRAIERGSLVHALPLIALGGLGLAGMGLFTGGLQPARLQGLPGAALLVMLLASACILARGWAFAARRTGSAERLLREAMAIETAVAARMGEREDVLRRRLVALLPEGRPIEMAQPAQTARAA